MATLTKEQQLEELETALHSLLTGKRAVHVQYGERVVKFDAGNIAELRAQIAMLKNEIAGTTRQPIGVVW